MGLRPKLAILFSTIALVPFVLFGFYAMQTVHTRMAAEIGLRLEAVAVAKARVLENLIEEYAHRARRLARYRTVGAAVQEANRRPADDPEITRIDQRWIAARAHTPEAAAIADTALSRFLREQQLGDPKIIGELLVTDHRGALIGMSRPTTDYWQGDEHWWQIASAGRGETVIEDRGFDLSTGTNVIGISVPIVRDGVVAGVLKINFRLEHILRVAMIAPAPRDAAQPGAEESLIRTDGRMVGGQLLAAGSAVAAQALTTHMQGKRSGTFLAPPPATAVVGFKQLGLAVLSRGLGPHAQPDVAGEDRGWTRWILVVRVPTATVFAFEREVRVRFLLVGAAVLVAVLLVSTKVADSIVRPVERLERGTAMVAAGDLRHRVMIDDHGEIGRLSRAFDAMTARLEETLASRAELDAEVAMRARVSEELRRANHLLARSNRDLEQFAYVASHDLQEPLRGMVAFAERLRKRCQGTLDPQADTYSQHVLSGARRMQAMITDLLAYSRATTRPLAAAPVDCGELLDEVLADLATAVADSGATITHGTLPVVVVDRGALKRVLQNLIGNAIKFRGPAPLTIAVGAMREGKGWQFCVRDNGIGIEPACHARIFELFQRLHPQARYPGTGLGLAMAKRIVERWGGELRVESHPPTAGSAFYFTLPDATS